MPPTETPPEMEQTEFGWAVVSDAMPPRGNNLWLKTPERHIYMFDEDGWTRVKPAEYHFIPQPGVKYG